MDERNVVMDLVRHSGLNAIAKQCHELATKRGKYVDWNTQIGHIQICGESSEWEVETLLGHRDHEAEEMGDLLHTVLSVACHRGIDVEQALRDAMQRNADRAREGV